MDSYQGLREKAGEAVARGDYERGYELVKAARRYFPRDFQADLLEGQIHMERGKLREARAAFEAVLEVDPESVVARSALGMVLGEQGDLDAALEQLERAFELDPTNGQIAAEISRVHSRLNHTTSTGLGSSMHIMARRLAARRKYDRAVPLFQEARFFAPRVVEVAVGAAEALWVTRRAAEAAAVAREIREAHPSCLKALAILAGSAFSEGDERWNELLRETGSLDPGNGLARMLFEEGGLVFPEMDAEVEIADEELPAEVPQPEEIRPPEIVADLAPKPRDREGVQGGILARLQATLSDEIVATAGASELQGKSGDAELHVSFARSFAARGQFDLALGEYRTAAKLNPEMARDVAEAVRAIVDADPDNVEAKLLVGDILCLDGSFRDAVDYYLSAMSKVEKEEDGTDASHSQA